MWMRGTAAMIKVYSILDAEPYLLQFDAILFDLDDTLYSEKDYIRSGFHQVAMLFPDDIDVEKNFGIILSARNRQLTACCRKSELLM